METTQELMSGSEVETLLDTLRQEAKRRKSKTFIAAMIAAIIVGSFIATIAARLLTHNHVDVFINPSSFIGVVIGLMAVSKTQKNATKELAKYDDVRSVGAFAEALAFRDGQIENIAEEKLIQLMPLMKATDAHLLNEQQRKNLNRAIEKRGSTVACAIMKAYEQVGNSDAIPVVERVARETHEKLRKQAAEHCLPFLQQRAATEKERQTLLRAADGNTQTSAPNMLLRPAAPIADNQPEILLRPAQAEDDTLATASGTTQRTADTKQYVEPNAEPEYQTVSVGTKSD